MQIEFIILIQQEIVRVTIGFEFEIKTETNFFFSLILARRVFSNIFIYGEWCHSVSIFLQNKTHSNINFKPLLALHVMTLFSQYIDSVNLILITIIMYSEI